MRKTKPYNKVPVVRDAGVVEAIVRPMDDVCPWDAAPEPNSEAVPDIAVPTSSGATASFEASSFDANPGLSQTLEFRPSRKNSSQLDSCSSSSDISIAIAEVSERLRKSCGPQPSSSTSATERVTTAMISRNFSVGSISGKVKLSDISKPSISSYTLPSPQQSLDLPHLVTENPESSSVVRTVSKEVEAQVRSDVKFPKDGNASVKSPALAPLISISAIVGDFAEDAVDSEQESVAGPSYECISREEQATQTSFTKVDANVQKDDDEVSRNTPVVQTELETEEAAEEAQVVPVWEPDTQQDSATAATASTQEQRDNNVNEVCPWEDE